MRCSFLFMFFLIGRNGIFQIHCCTENMIDYKKIVPMKLTVIDTTSNDMPIVIDCCLNLTISSTDMTTANTWYQYNRHEDHKNSIARRTVMVRCTTDIEMMWRSIETDNIFITNNFYVIFGAIRPHYMKQTSYYWE